MLQVPVCAGAACKGGPSRAPFHRADDLSAPAAWLLGASPSHSRWQGALQRIPITATVSIKVRVKRAIACVSSSARQVQTTRASAVAAAIGPRKGTAWRKWPLFVLIATPHPQYATTEVLDNDRVAGDRVVQTLRNGNPGFEQTNAPGPPAKGSRPDALAEDTNHLILGPAAAPAPDPRHQGHSAQHAPRSKGPGVAVPGRFQQQPLQTSAWTAAGVPAL